MKHTVIPAPVRFDTDDGRYPLRSGATVGYVDRDLAPIVERFCSELTRRTRLRLEPRAGKTGVDETYVTVELTTGDDFDVLPAQQGLSPIGDTVPDERHSLSIDADGIVVRAAEPVGAARALTTLIQLLATTSSTRGAPECGWPFDCEPPLRGGSRPRGGEAPARPSDRSRG